MSTSTTAGQREVEVKYLVEDEDAGRLLAALTAAGVVLSEPFRQDDQAYAPAAWAYGMSKLGVPFARLRSQSGQVLFAVKVPRANELDCAEQESVVEDRAAMHEALLLMGMVPTVRIVKDRRTGSWDGAQVCVDLVHSLGTFVELERMVGGTSAEDVQAEMDRQVRDLGVAVQRMTQTYDSLLRSAA